MAKFLPFVNSETPLHTLVDKLYSKYGSTHDTAEIIQIMRIIKWKGIEEVEKTAKLHESSKSSSSVISYIIRNLSDATTSYPYHTSVIRHFIQYIENLDDDGRNLSRLFFYDAFISLGTPEQKIILLSALFNADKDQKDAYLRLPITEYLEKRLHEHGIKRLKIFNSTTVMWRNFVSREDLEAYVLLISLMVKEADKVPEEFGISHPFKAEMY